MRTGKGYSGNMVVGSKYNETCGLALKEIAKLVKSEIKSLYPKVKFSVKTNNYSLGSSLDVTITDINFNPFTKEYQHHLDTNSKTWEGYRSEQYNERYLELEKKIRSIIFQYNYNDDDIQSDYHDSGFHYAVSIDNTNIVSKFHPNNLEAQRSIKFWADVEEKKKAAKKKADNVNKSGFKKGDEVIYIYRGSKTVPAGAYTAVITKVPNGRARFSTFSIRFDVHQRYVNGELKTLNRPMVYESEIWNESELKDKATYRKEKIDAVLND